MADKMWHGRFVKSTHPLLEKFSESLSFDRELAEVDIRGSLAHVAMLVKVGLLDEADGAAITEGLRSVRKEIRGGTFVFNSADEDIHMAIEARLTALIGEPAKRLHTARSRNDQVATDLRLWLRDKIGVLRQLIANAQLALLRVANREISLVIPGYTHLQRAQPVLLAQHLLAYVEMFGRDAWRFADTVNRLNFSPLGAGALAGTTLPIDRHFTAKKLGFAGICENSMDAVSDRDFAIETLSTLSILFAHLSRFGEDVILWASSEFRLVRLDDAWSTGSSIMPQKRNPDFLELTRGKAGGIFGSLLALLVTVKGLPLAYNRDLQEDKQPVFSAVATAEATLTCLEKFIPTLEFNRARAEEMLAGGFLEATAIAEYLVEKKLPFREAHAVAGKLVRIAEDSGRRLADLSLDEMIAVSPLFDSDIRLRLDARSLPDLYKSAGSAGTNEVKRQLARWQVKLAKARDK